MYRTFALVTKQSHGLFSQSILEHSAKSLYTASSLGLDGYIASREKTKGYFITNADSFKQKMEEFTKEDSKQMVFSEDLKNMVHLAEKNDSELVVKMMKKFASQNKELRFGTYVFGPVVMRMFYHLGDEENALKCFLDKNFEGFFSQWMSYQILLDMLFEKGRYEDMLKAYEVIKSMQVEGSMYPRHVMTLIFAACYKMNTADSYKYAMDLWKHMIEHGHFPMRKTATFAAALALAHNAPHEAVEILSTTKQQKYITVRNLKVLALLELGRSEDIIPVLRSVLEADSPQTTKQSFCRKVIDRARETIAQSQNKELKLDFERIDKFLNDHKHITEDTLDSLLCSEVNTTMNSQNTGSKNQTVLNASFSRQGGYRPRRQQYNNRPGLAELY